MRLIVAAAFFVLLASSGAVAKTTNDPEFPGVGSQKSWDEGCVINTKATELMQNDQHKKAVVLLKQAIAKYPYETGFYNNLGHCYVSLGDSKSAEAAYRKAVELCEKYRVKYPDSYLELARLCEKRGAVKDADKYYQKATKLFGTADCWRSYADFLKSQKRMSESAAARKKVTELEQGHKQFLKGLGK